MDYELSCDFPSSASPGLPTYLDVSAPNQGSTAIWATRAVVYYRPSYLPLHLKVVAYSEYTRKTPYMHGIWHHGL